MQRIDAIEKIDSQKEWDVIVIGGGASGLGAALDAVTRGYSTLLLEAHDFAKGTSSRSTKLVHGGVRYLAQGNVALVKEALRERGRLAFNAPHLFKSEAFIIPGEKWWSSYYYFFGLWLYDRLAGKLSIGKTKFLTKGKAIKALEGVKTDKLRNAVCYYDGQFDDARLALNLAQTITDHKGVVLNYAKVTSLSKNEKGQLNGVTFKDQLTDRDYTVNGRCIINATGVFANDLIAMDEPNSKPSIVPSQGVHLVLDQSFLPSVNTLMVPKTSDGRVLFAVPWHDKIVVGTTDTLVKNIEYEPKALEEEIEFILKTASEYLVKTPKREDVLSVFVGLRPLAAPKSEGKSTKEVSRSHKIEVSSSGFIHIIGGKWTTYRQMAEDAIDEAIKHNLLPEAKCQTYDLRLHGYEENAREFGDSPLSYYGSDKKELEKLIAEDESLAQKIDENYEYNYAQVLWAIKNEMAHSLEDILARRIRLLFLDAKTAKRVAPDVADFMANICGWSDARTDAEIESFSKLCDHYSL